MKHRSFFIPLIVLGFIALLAGCVNLSKIVIGNPDFSAVPDNTYRGKSKVGPVQVTVDVTVEGGIIKSIDLIQHFNGRGKKAEVIIPRVIEAQSLNVDVISGATGSSKAILQAIERAVTQ
ncbi:MAG: FMN-binding protein [Treponema sp.]|nr:FMN-binding protein [Treponema sp.]